MQNVDTSAGTITISTADGEIIMLKTDNSTQAIMKGRLVPLQSLEIGSSVIVDLQDDRRTVKLIRDREPDIQAP